MRYAGGQVVDMLKTGKSKRLVVSRPLTGIAE